VGSNVKSRPFTLSGVLHTSALPLRIGRGKFYEAEYGFGFSKLEHIRRRWGRIRLQQTFAPSKAAWE